MKLQVPTNPTLSILGLSRENSTASAGRPGSAMSGGAANSRTISGVRMRSAPGSRRPRPMSIATTGMTSSMYEERQKPAHFVRDKSCTLTNFLYFPFKVLSSAFYKLREFCFGFSILYSFLTGVLINILG